MEMKKGTPWLDQPVMLHSSRKYTCSLPTAALCKWQQGYWRFWYEADHRFALPTIAFFMATIIVFAIPYLLSNFSRRPSRHALVRKPVAMARYLAYRSYRIRALNWNSAPLGVLLLAAVGTIYFFAMTLGPRPYYWPNKKKPAISFGNSPPIATRSGWMSLACLPFIMATSTKSNMITALTGVSHEKLQVFHRWISYACFVLALIHTFPFIVFDIWKGTMESKWNSDVTYWTGVVAIIAQAWLTFASMSPLRSLSYELFKSTHFVAALVFVVFFFLHCDFRLTSWDYFIATGVIYTLCWLHSHLRIFFQYGVKTATVSVVSNGFIKITIPMRDGWHAGQHFFIRVFGLGVHGMTTHPFTACSLPASARSSANDLIFYIRPQGGFTARLAKHAQQHPSATMKVLLDGPYGGIDMRRISSSRRVVAIAGGSGAGWLLPLIEDFLRRESHSTVAMTHDDKMLELHARPSMKAILVTRDIATRNWFEQTISELLAQTGHSGSGLSVEIHYTGSEKSSTHSQYSREEEKFDLSLGEQANGDINGALSNALDAKHSAHDDVERAFAPKDIFSRPELPAIIREEVDGESESMSVLVCGPLGMQDDVSNAVARAQIAGIKDGKRDVYLHMEHFSWA